MKRVVLIAVVLSIVLLSLTSCASMFGKSYTNVKIDSVPQGADVIIDGVKYGVTPITLPLGNEKGRIIQIEKDGYEPYIARVNKKAKGGFMWLDVLTFGMGHMIDLVNANGYALKPNKIQANLVEVK